MSGDNGKTLAQLALVLATHYDLLYNGATHYSPVLITGATTCRLDTSDERGC